MKNKLYIAVFLQTLVIGVLLFTLINEPDQVEVYKKRQAQRDSLLVLYSTMYQELQIENDSLKTVSDSLSLQTDSSFYILTELTKPQVTDSTINKALEWVNLQQ